MNALTLFILHITDIALVIHLSTRAVGADYLSFKLFTIEALRILLTSHIRNLLAHKTLDVSVATVIWGPKLKI